jgi:anti-sigma B factor antagonist
MRELAIHVAERPYGARLLTLQGPVTLNALFALQSIIRQAATDLVIDLGGVPVMDSAGLGAILGAFASCERHGHHFGLANTPPRIVTLLRVSKVDNILPQYDSVEAAGQSGAKAQSA